MKRLITAAAAALVAAVTFAIPASAGTTVTVDLWDAGPDLTMVDNLRIADNPDLSKAPMGIKISQMTVPAGTITFNATNSSKDIEHEMVVGELPDKAAGLPYKANSGRVDENVPGANIGEIAELEPGETGTLTLTLHAGTYALYCNVAGHYASGMWVILTVE